MPTQTNSLTIGERAIPQTPAELSPQSHLGRLWHRSETLSRAALSAEELSKERALRERAADYERLISRANGHTDHQELAAALAGLPLVERDLRAIEIARSDLGNSASAARANFTVAWQRFLRDCSDLEDVARNGLSRPDLVDAILSVI